jgi:lactoylglutathione lyase
MKTKLFIFSVLLIFGNSLGSVAQSKPTIKFNHLAIFVMDLNVSRHFYTQVIGLDTIAEPFHDKKHLWLDIGFGSAIHVIAGAEKKKEYFLGNHLCLSTSDMNDFKKRLEKHKVDWQNYQGQKGQTTMRTDGVLQIWLQDPDGYWIEVNNDNSTFDAKR